MLEHVMKALSEDQQDLDGEVRRREFDPPNMGDEEVTLGEKEREELETEIFEMTPVQHRLTTATGGRAVCYFDERGRASTANLSSVSDGELMRLSDRQRLKGHPGTGDKGGEITTVTEDGNEVVVTEQQLVEMGPYKYRVVYQVKAHPGKDQYTLSNSLPGMKKVAKERKGKLQVMSGKDWKDLKESEEGQLALIL